jgi:hypothetical protein
MDHSVPTRRELLGVSVLAASALAAPAFVSGAASAAGEKNQTKWNLSGDYFGGRRGWPRWRWPP